MTTDEKIRQLIVAQMEELAGLLPERAAQIVRAAKRAQASLLKRLKALGPESFSAQFTRARLVEIAGIVDRSGAEWGELVGREGQAAAVEAALVGRRGIVKQLQARSEKFAGLIGSVATVGKAAGLGSPGLLEYYRQSREAYGLEAIARMRSLMMRSALEGDSLPVTWAKVSDKMDMPIWRAERIARTEHSFAMHRAQVQVVRDLFGASVDQQWRKQLITSFDQRTGSDSVSVHNQIRPINKPFRDNEGRVYMQPPNRPNDREVMVLLPEWADANGDMPDAEMEPFAARWRKLDAEGRA